MRLALDTQAYSDFCRGLEKPRAAVRNAALVILPLTVLGELRAGFCSGSRGAQNEGILERFLAEPRVEVMAPDEETTHHYGRMFAQLRGQGTPIPTNDLWIAALSFQHRLTLFTEDAHYRHLPQLTLYTPPARPA